MRKPLLVIFLALVSLIAGGIGIKRGIETMPEYALYRGVQALQHQNVSQFKTVVDVDAVAHAWVQQHVQQVCKPDASEETGAVGLFFSGLFRDFGCEMADRASTVIEPELKGRLLSRIEAGNLLSSRMMREPLHPYWGTLGIRLAAFIPITPSQTYRIIRVDRGDLVTLQIEVLDLNSKVAHYDIGLQRRSNGWRVITYASVARPALRETPGDDLGSID